MVKKIKDLYEKYREMIVYLIVGVLTTIVSWGVLFIGKLFLNIEVDWQNFLNNTLSWVGGVLFAYPLNRKWVFKSNNPHIIKEFSGFAASRVSTWILDVIIMWLFVNVITFKGLINWGCGLIHYPVTESGLSDLNYWFVKICISSVLVMIANYVFSKILVFKKKKTDSAEE